MFVISKIFWLIAQPMSLAMLLILSGIVSGAYGNSRIRLLCLSGAASILFIALFTTTGAVATGLLEKRFSRPAVLDKPPTCAIILGGGFDGTISKVRGGFELGSAGDRFVEGLRLARLYPDMTLIITGGDPSLDNTTEGDADIAERFYLEFGIDASRLILERESRNTEENAAFTAPVLKANGLSSCLLITSAFHMPRSAGLFRKAGIDFIPWPVDFKTTGHEPLSLDFFELGNNAALLEISMHEFVGLAVSYMNGKSETLFPLQDTLNTTKQ